MDSVAPYSTIASAGPGLGALIQQHIDITFRALMSGPGIVATDRFIRLVTGEPHPFGNFALVSNPQSTEDTQEAIEPLCTCGAPAAVLFPGPPSAEVNAALQQAGFGEHDPMPAMAVEIDRLPATKLPQGYEMDRITRGRGGAAWAAAFSRGYELPLRVAETFSPEHVEAGPSPAAPAQFFAVRKGADIVCTAMFYLRNGLAGVYCVSTIPEERCKGLGAYITVETLRRAQQAGYRVGVLQSSAAGYSTYRRLGFTDFGGVPLYVRMPAAES